MMQRFSFRLQPVLKLRERAEEAVKIELGKKNGEILAACERLDSLQDELRNLQLSQKQERTERADLTSMRWGVAYRHHLKRSMLSQGNQIEKLRSDAFGIQRRLTKAMQARKALEILRDRQRAHWQEEYNRTVQNFIDDVGQQGYIRDLRNAGERMRTEPVAAADGERDE